MQRAMLDRLRAAWTNTTLTQVVSESIYDFDIENNLLRIQDHDFIFVGRDEEAGLSLPPEVYPIKEFRSTATHIGHELLKCANEFSDAGVIPGGTSVSTARLELERSPNRNTLAIRIGTAHRFERAGRYRLSLQYSVPLDAGQTFLLFSGAIQPSDYDIVAKLGVKQASKSISLLVRRSKPFAAYIFEPAKMNYFPERQPAKHSRPYDWHVIATLDTVMENYGRARYFTLAADLS